MRSHAFRYMSLSLAASAIAIATASIRPAVAQNPDVQKKIADLKESLAKNKQALAQYTWVEEDTISIKGEQRKKEQFQVSIDSDGKQRKSPINLPDQPQSSGGRGGRLKQHVVEKKVEEYKEYADQIRDLLQQYVPPDKDRLEFARVKGNVHVQPPADASGQYTIVISGYIREGDNVTLVIDGTRKNVVSLSIASYLNQDPKDAVTVSAHFAALPNGPNHVASLVVNGVSKQLTIAIANGNYQKN